MPESEDADPVGIKEIAARAGVDREAVERWRERHPDFPAPRWTVGGRPAWNWPTVAVWLGQTARSILPAGLSGSRIPGQQGRLYEFNVDASIGATRDALQAVGLADYTTQGRWTQFQTWDRDQAIAAYQAVATAGLPIVGARPERAGEG